MKPNETIEPEMPAVITELKRKIRLSVVKDHLKRENLKTPNTWEDLSIEQKENLNFLEIILEGSLVFGEKTGCLYNTTLESLPPPPEKTNKSVLGLLKKPPENYVFFKEWESEKCVCHTYAIIREKYISQKLLASDLSADARDKYWKDDTEIKIRYPEKYCAFDSILFLKENKQICILLDSLHHTQIERDAHEGSFLAWIDPNGTLRNKSSILDLFPSIQSMYSYPDEGLVSRLGFECITGVVRDEKLRPGLLDLRKEKYHEEGKKAIGEISPFKVSLTYTQNKYANLKTELTFSINGTRRDLARKGGVFYFSIDSQSSFSEADFCLKRLGLYAGNEPTA